eukprot:24107-Pelagococcus_subviridis.AAC.1
MRMRAIVGVELKGVRSGVERRSSRCVGIVSEWWWAERNARRARKSWRAPRRRGRTGTGVRIERASLGPASGASGFGRLRSSPRSNPTSSRSPPAPLASPPCSATARASNPGPPPTPSPSTRPVVRKLCSSSSVPRSNPSACAYRRSTVFIKNGLGCVGGGRYTGAAPAGGGCPGWIAPCARASSSARIAARNRRVRASACSASRNVPRTASLSLRLDELQSARRAEDVALELAAFLLAGRVGVFAEARDAVEKFRVLAVLDDDLLELKQVLLRLRRELVPLRVVLHRLPVYRGEDGPRGGGLLAHERELIAAAARRLIGGAAAEEGASEAAAAESRGRRPRGDAAGGRAEEAAAAGGRAEEAAARARARGRRSEQRRRR